MMFSLWFDILLGIICFLIVSFVIIIINKGKYNDITDLYKANKKIKEQKAEIICWKDHIRDQEETIGIYKRENKQLRIKLEKYEKKNND